MKAGPTLWLILVPLLAWAILGLFGDRVAANISSRFGARILAKADDKFTDVQSFVKGRLKDGTVLLSSASLLFLAYRMLAARAGRRLQSPARWILQGWSAFICLNVLAAISAHTVLFWCLLFTGKDHTVNYTQYHIKEGLMEENNAPGQAVLMGASQTHAQIDPKLLNERLGRAVWTTELHFPGSNPYDMLLCFERLPRVRLDYVITYVSEANFYGLDRTSRLMYFLGLRDLKTYLALSPGVPVINRYVICGLLGDVFPLYRIWEPLVARVRGWQVENAAQAQHDATLEANLETRAHAAAKGYCFGPNVSFQKSAFSLFAKMCRERRCRLVVCCGHLNPIFERALDPALHRDMIEFLRNQAKQDPNIVLLEEPQLPRQVESDYDDLTHANRAARDRFSQYIADVLEKLSQHKSL